MSLKKLTGNFTIIPNHILNDVTLSFKAKGLWVYINSKPEGWDFSIEKISKATKEGEKSVRSGLTELREAGYLEYKPKFDFELKKLVGQEYILYSEKQYFTKPVVPKTSGTQNGGCINNKEYSNKEYSNTLSIEERILEKIEEIKSNPMYSQAKDSNFPLLDEKEIELELKIYLSDYPNSKVTTIFSFLADKNKQKRNQKQTKQNQIPNQQTIIRNYQTLAL